MRILHIPAKGLLILLLAVSCSTRKSVSEVPDTKKMLDYCVAKTEATMNSLSRPDSIPRNICPGQTQWNKVNIYDWTSGFWPGVLWEAYEASGNASILANARKYTESLRGVLSVPVDNHDLGFMLYLSFGNGYRLTKDSVYHQFLLTAADSLATLYNPKVGTILSWPAMRAKMNWPHNTIIDNLINLEMLFWASKNGGKQQPYTILRSNMPKPVCIR